MLVPPEDVSEEWTASTQNHLVSLDLLIFTGKSDIKKVFVITQFSKCMTDIVFKIVPPQTKFFTCHFDLKQTNNKSKGLGLEAMFFGSFINLKAGVSSISCS